MRISRYLIFVHVPAGSSLESGLLRDPLKPAESGLILEDPIREDFTALIRARGAFAGVTAAAGHAPPVTMGRRIRNRFSNLGRMMTRVRVVEDSSQRVEKLKRAQALIDRENLFYRPQLWMPFEIAGPEIGRIEIGPFIARSHYSAVFRVANARALAIKYQGDCEKYDREVHPLLIDFWFGRIAADAGVAARPLFISPGALMRDFCIGAGPIINARPVCGQNPILRAQDADRASTSATIPIDKLQFYQLTESGDHELAETCRRDGMARYMVMERVENCLGAHLSDPVTPQEAVQIGIEMIGLLQRLHSAGIVHGDIHVGNVCRRMDMPHSLVLIDFGAAFFTSREVDDLIRFPLSWVHTSFTPWQLNGHANARRDDIYRALYLVATVMLGPALRGEVTRLMQLSDGEKPEMGEERLLEWKKSGPLFKTETGDPIAKLRGMTDGHVDLIHTELNDIHKEVMKLDEVASPIPYVELIDRFEHILTLMGDYDHDG